MASDRADALYNQIGNLLDDEGTVELTVHTDGGGNVRGTVREVTMSLLTLDRTNLTALLIPLDAITQVEVHSTA